MRAREYHLSPDIFLLQIPQRQEDKQSDDQRKFIGDIPAIRSLGQGTHIPSLGLIKHNRRNVSNPLFLY